MDSRRLGFIEALNDHLVIMQRNFFISFPFFFLFFLLVHTHFRVG